MRNNHLHDPETGEYIGTIQDGSIISDISRETIGHVRDGIAYGVDGTAWGSIENADTATGSSLPERMREALRVSNIRHLSARRLTDR